MVGAFRRPAHSRVGRVEDHLDVADPRLALDQRAQRGVHLVDHARQCAHSAGVAAALPSPPSGQPGLPHRARLRAARTAVGARVTPDGARNP